MLLQEGFNGEGGSFQLIGMCKAATVSVSGASFFFLVDMANMVCLLCSAEVAPTVLRVSRGVAEKGVGH